MSEVQSKKAQKKTAKGKETTAKVEVSPDVAVLAVVPADLPRFYLSDNEKDDLQVALAAVLAEKKFVSLRDQTPLIGKVLSFPAYVTEDVKLFGSHAIASFLTNQIGSDAEVQKLANVEAFELVNGITAAHLSTFESKAAIITGSVFLRALLLPYLIKADLSGYAALQAAVADSADILSAAGGLLKNSEYVKPDIETIPVDTPVLDNVDWSSVGLFSGLTQIFNAAIKAAFPMADELPAPATGNIASAYIMRCSNPAFGDFQCNNAMGLSKALKTAGYGGKTSPKDLAERLISAIPTNPMIESASAVPNGFINIKITASTLIDTISSVINNGVKAPVMPKQNVLVDFSSPNIAKEMHVGHLRSTIIGDSVCRIFEFCGHNVHRVNHVGDWGTQFGMLITYLLETYPNILNDPSCVPNISDLTAIYKASKARFDADVDFKERSRLNVVSLQSGDETCRGIWNILCDVSRAEFQKVYDLLGVTLEEFGESFYNPMIPGVIEELEKKGLVEDEEGMKIIRLPHFTIPLIVRKSDGGYGYDSTDMAALKYRLFDVQADRIICITDAGQAPHFHMCFDAATAAGWLDERAALVGKKPRLDHIGFGVVCGDDGKRFKTRSSETVRLIDLLNAAKDAMAEQLKARVAEGKSPMSEDEVETASKQIGYGAVKYFDLKQHPSTNYIFSYDRMLDTRGDTAVYLLFAYARLASILRKAKEERGIDLESFKINATDLLNIDSPAERALAFEMLQFGDVIESVLNELLPNRICDYLQGLSVKFTDFVTKCHVLNADSEDLVKSRLLLCEATRRVMAQCFSLLGINPLERI